jgi:hypothetical protein
MYLAEFGAKLLRGRSGLEDKPEIKADENIAVENNTDELDLQFDYEVDFPDGRNHSRSAIFASSQTEVAHLSH